MRLFVGSTLAAAVVFTLALSFPTPASADAQARARCCNTPTVWTFINETPQTLHVACHASVRGLAYPVTFNQQVAAGATTPFPWHGWYNDGMGLNGGRWRCAVDTAAAPLTRTEPARSYFRTGWGENIRVRMVLEDGKYRLKKQ